MVIYGLRVLLTSFMAVLNSVQHQKAGYPPLNSVQSLASVLVPIHKWLFSPISLLGGNFNPRNISHMPAAKISARLKLDENISFLDGHVLTY
jgi:hypothetical protein